MEFEQAHIVIGNLQIRYYGIIIVVALLAGAYIASLLASRSGRDSDHIWGGLTWAIVPGIIGARLWFVLFPPISPDRGLRNRRRNLPEHRLVYGEFLQHAERSNRHLERWIEHFRRDHRRIARRLSLPQ